MSGCHVTLRTNRDYFPKQLQYCAQEYNWFGQYVREIIAIYFCHPYIQFWCIQGHFYTYIHKGP